MSAKLYTVYQVADLLGSTPGQVLEWVRSGRIPSQGEGGQSRIPEAGLVRFLQSEGIDIEQVLAKAVLAAAPRPAPVAVAEVIDDAGAAAGDPAERLAEAILKDAVARRAEAIHLEPFGGGLALRLRVDGALQEKVNFRLRLPPTIAQGLIAHFEKRAHLSAEASAAHGSGHFTASLGGTEVRFRVSACPTRRGRRLVIFVTDGGAPRLGLKELGLGAGEEAVLRRLLEERCGLLLLTGRPRSGATATLRALAAELAGPQRSLFWIGMAEQDGLGDASQVPSRRDGLGGAETVQAASEQDADAIVLDGIWDAPTLAAAAEAALAGSLVLGRVHEKTPAAALQLLRTTGLAPWRLATALLAVAAQTTVRTLCPACKRETAPSAADLERLGLRRVDLGFAPFVPGGCGQCANTGYGGRTGVFSILEVNDEVAMLLRDGADMAAISGAARRAGMRTLREAGMELARRGETSLEELARVITPLPPRE